MKTKTCSELEQLFQHLNAHVWVTSAKRLLCKCKWQVSVGGWGQGGGDTEQQSYNISSKRTLSFHIYDLHSQEVNMCAENCKPAFTNITYTLHG